MNFLEVLEQITSKEIEALKPADILFLRARKSYLTEEQLEKYDSILNTAKPKGSNNAKKTSGKSKGKPKGKSK